MNDHAAGASPVDRTVRPAAEARWYCLDRDGVAMLCKDEADARAQVIENDDCWPGRAPHRAALLGDVAAERKRWESALKQTWQAIAYGEAGPTDAEIGRQWRENSSLEKWFPITAERLAAMERENLHLAREARTWWEAAQTYAKQAQRTPLDPLDVEELWDRANADDAADEVHHAFARLLERAHGIGAEHG